MSSGWKAMIWVVAAAILAGCADGETEDAPVPPRPTPGAQVLPSVADPPIIPFAETSDLYVMDGECGCILRIDAEGSVTIAVERLDIEAVTGWAGVSFDDCGMAFDRAGALFFVEADSDSILRRDPSGELTQLVSREAIQVLTGDDAVDPEGLTFGEDGMLYLLEDDEGAILRVDPSSGQLSVFVTDDELAEQTAIPAIDLGNHIVGGAGRTLYVVSHGEPPAIIAVDSGQRARVVTDSPELGDAEGFLTLDSEGNLVLMNKGQGVVQRIRPDGTLSVLLSVERLAAIFGDEVRLAGGAAFDAEGYFFLTEDDTESIVRLDAAMQGGIWIDEPTVRAVTGSDPDYESSVAFSPGSP